MARLVLNGGSSSWKCSVYDVAPDARAREADATPALAEANLSWPSPNSDHATLNVRSENVTRSLHQTIPRASAVGVVLSYLASNGGGGLTNIDAVGHRIVHGADAFTQTTWLDAAVIERLRALEPFAPSHNAIELAAVATVATMLPNVPQYAVFDTQFHHTLDETAYTYPGPYLWRDKKIRRYGFHGSSVAYATERAAELLERDATQTQLIVAHLGSGCSVTAIRHGRSVDTSMGFTPLDGTMMGSRSGAIDPAIAIFLMREAARENSSTSLADFADDLDRMLNVASGLAGISGISGDVREIRKAAAADANNVRATLAIDLFVHRLAATIASLLPALDRLDAIVFTGGIGEHDADIRDRTCARLAPLLVHPGDTVRTFVLTAREDWFIAREGARLQLRNAPASNS